MSSVAMGAPQPNRLLVLGMGNEILCDDAVGLRALALVEARVAHLIDNKSVTIRYLQTAGLDLIYEVEGYDTLIVVDAYFAPDACPGRVRELEAGDLKGSDTMDSAHLLGLPSALEISSRLGYHTPKLLRAVLVDVSDRCLTFGEGLSDEVAEGAKRAAEIVTRLIQEHCR